MQTGWPWWARDTEEGVAGEIMIQVWQHSSLLRAEAQRPKGPFQGELVKEEREGCSGWEWHHLSHACTAHTAKGAAPSCWFSALQGSSSSCRELINCSTCRISGSETVISSLGTSHTAVNLDAGDWPWSCTLWLGVQGSLWARDGWGWKL